MGPRLIFQLLVLARCHSDSDQGNIFFERARLDAASTVRLVEGDHAAHLVR